MNNSNLYHIDMNLLVILASLLETQSTTKTAQELGKSQSAISHSLRKIRETFGDPILVRDGQGLVPTARAIALQPTLIRWLDDANTFLFQAPDFVPATAETTLRLAASDYVLTTVLPRLLPRCQSEAPGINLRFMPPSSPDACRRAMADGRLDLAFMVSGLPDELRAVRLFNDEFTSLVAQDHPIGDGPFDIETYAASRHVLTAPLGNADASYLSKRLEASGLTRRVALSIPHFSVGPTVLAGSDLVLTIPKRLAEHYARVFGHRMVPLAFDVPPISVFLTWHERQHRDPAHRWLRQCLREAFQED